MSERGSFVTQYIYCRECLKTVEAVLLDKRKYLCSQRIEGWEMPFRQLPIIAGKVGGLHEGEELEDFEKDYIPAISKRICHPVRIAVLAEEGEAIYTVEPAAP